MNKVLVANGWDIFSKKLKYCNEWSQYLTLDNLSLIMHGLSQLLGSKDWSTSKLFSWILFQFSIIGTSYPKVRNISCAKQMTRMDTTSKLMFVPPKSWDLDALTH